MEMFHCGSQSGVWLLAAQKAMERQYWWKGKFALFWRLAAVVGVVDSCLMTDCPLPTDRQWARASAERGRGACRNSTVSSDGHLEFGPVVV